MMQLMQLSDLSVGSKVTIHSHNSRTYRNEPSAVVTISAISARVLRTSDGQRWHPNRGTQLDENGKEWKRGPRIYPYQNGDEAIVRKVALVDKCRDLLSPTYPHDSPMDNMGLLCEEDWAKLAEISERYKEALANKKTS
jgi:hypothetical protein